MTNDVEHEVPFLCLNFSYNVHVFLFVYLLHLFFNSFKNHYRWFMTVVLKVCSHTSSIGITWKLTKNTDFQVPLSIY